MKTKKEWGIRTTEFSLMLLVALALTGHWIAFVIVLALGYYSKVKRAK